MFIILKLAYWNPIGVMIGAVMQLGNLYSVNSWRSENEDEGRGSGITQKHRNLFIYYGKKYPIANVKKLPFGLLGNISGNIYPLHYDNKFTKTFRLTNILHINAKFEFGVFHQDFFCNKSAKY